MMKLKLKSEYNKISMLTKIEFKRILNQLSNIILLVLLFIIFVNMFIFIYRDSGVKIHSRVALAIEDNSFEVNTLMKNITENKLKGIVDFRESSLDSGLELLRRNEVIALIHVEEGTAKLLNYGKKASLNLYINDSNNITVKFLIEYLENLIEVLNEGQNGAMIYWDVMKDEGFNFDERINELNKIALKYMSAFLTRGTVFENSMDLDKFYGASLISYYFATSLIIISVISAILFHLDINDDFKKGRIRRVLNSGFSLWHIYFAKIIAGITFSTLLATAFKGIFMIFFNAFTIAELIRFISYFSLVNTIIHMLVLTFYISIDNDIIRDWSFVIFFIILSFSSGIILPLTSMGMVFNYLSKLNLLTIGHNLLLGYSLTFERALVILMYFSILTVSIRYIHKKRGV